MTTPRLSQDDAPVDEVDLHRMPLLDHLKELRDRALWAAGALILGMLASLSFVEEIYHWLTSPFLDALADAGVKGGLSLVHSPFESIYTWLAVAFFGGVVLALPMIAFQCWQFVAPGLYSTEKRIVLPLAFCSSVLFLAGALFAYYAIFPLAFPFFLQVLEVDVSLSISGYLKAIVKMMVAFGLCFQLPVISFFLARMGLVDHIDMVKGFRYAIPVIFVFAALLTPPDPLTQTALGIPLVLLYGVGIVVAYFTSTKVREEG